MKPSTGRKPAGGLLLRHGDGRPLPDDGRHVSDLLLRPGGGHLLLEDGRHV